MKDLQYYLHDEPDVFRIEIVGNLSGAGVASIDYAWRTAYWVLAGRPMVVGLTAVAEADDDGRDPLTNFALLRRTNHRTIHGFPYVSREHFGRTGPNGSGEVGSAAAVQRSPPTLVAAATKVDVRRKTICPANLNCN